MSNRSIFFLVLLFILVLIVLMFSFPLEGFSHDREHPEWDNWLSGLSSGKGPCCDGSDSRRVDDADWETKDGHYRVRLDGEWVDIPDDAVIKQPNIAGRTMVWPFYQDGQPKVRCFIPGTMG